MVFSPFIEWRRVILADATQLVHLLLKKNTIISLSWKSGTGNSALLSRFLKRAPGQSIEIGSLLPAHAAANERPVALWLKSSHSDRVTIFFVVNFNVFQISLPRNKN